MSDEQRPRDEELAQRSLQGQIVTGLAVTAISGGVKVGAKLIGHQVKENLESLKRPEPPKED
jgi:hypothetical protein